MALSGSQSINIHGGAHTLIVEWSANQNVSGNYSAITANLYIKGNYSYSTIYSGSVAKPVALVINGNRKSGTARIDISGTEKRLLLSHSVNVGHNADGTKTFRLEGMLNSQITWSGTYYGSEEWTRQGWSLNAIPRASTFNQSATSFNMDGEGTIYINPANASFKHKLYMHFGNKRPLLKDNPPVNQNFNVQFSASEFASQIPNATSGVGTLTLETYNENTLIGSSSRQTYLKLPSNYVPSQPSVTVSDESSVPAKLGVSKTAGIYVKGMSLLRFNCSASGVLGSTINNYQVQIGNQTFATGGGTIDVDLSKFDVGVGKVKAIVTVTDSRGRSNSKTVELNIREYQAPKILNFNVSRQNNSDTVIITKKAKAQKIVSSNRTVLATNYEYSQGAIDTYSKSGYTGTWNTSTPLSNLTVGEVVLLQLYNTSRCDYDLIIASVNTINSNSVNTTSIGLDNSTNYNSYTVKTEYKLTSASSWTVYRTETDSSATLNLTGFNVANSYDIRITLADKLNQTVVQASISTAKVLLDFNRDTGIGIGKMHERGVLDVGGDSYFGGKVQFTGGIEYVIIPDNADLNDYRTVGFYRIPYDGNGTSGGSSIKNSPISSCFSMKVEQTRGIGSSGDVVFRQILLSPYDNRIFTRRYAAGTWTSWVEIIDSSTFNNYFDTRFNQTMSVVDKGSVGLPYGIVANAHRSGKMVNLAVGRQVITWNATGENNAASERLPDWAIPSQQQTLVLQRNAGIYVSERPTILHLYTDGAIKWTNQTTGQHVFTGSITYFAKN